MVWTLHGAQIRCNTRPSMGYGADYVMKELELGALGGPLGAHTCHSLPNAEFD